MIKPNKILICAALWPLLCWGIVFGNRELFVSEVVLSFLPQAIVINTVWIFCSLLLLRSNAKFKTLLFFLPQLLVLFSCCNLIFNFYQPNFYSIHESNEQTLKILSLNLNPKNTSFGEISDKILKLDPDVMVLLEFSSIFKSELELLLINYPYTTLDTSLTYSDVVIFSKFKITNQQDFTNFIRVQIDFQNQTQTIYGIHATAPVTPKLLTRRNQDIDNLLAHVNLDERIILTGDFNLTPWTKTYQEFVNNLSLKNISRDHFGFTWLAYRIPIAMLHVDHFFIDPTINLINYQIVDIPGSDHKGLFATLKV